jgi:hypothetical protein
MKTVIKLQGEIPLDGAAGRRVVRMIAEAIGEQIAREHFDKLMRGACNDNEAPHHSEQRAA